MVRTGFICIYIPLLQAHLACLYDLGIYTLELGEIGSGHAPERDSFVF